MLFVAEVGNVGEDQVIALHQQLRRLRHALRRYRQLLEPLVARTGVEGFAKERPQVGEVRRNQIPLGLREINQAAENWRPCEGTMQGRHASFSTRIAIGQADPELALVCYRLPTPSEPQPRQWPEAASAGIAPCLQGQREGGNCHAAAVQLQAVQVVAQYRIDRIRGGEALRRHADGDQAQERGNEEVARTTTRVQHLECGQVLRPSLESAARRGDTCVQRGHWARLVWETGGPPCA